MHRYRKYGVVFMVLLILGFSCHKDDILIVPEDGYNWPDNERVYWPTDGWLSEPMEAHNINAGKMAVADEFAQNDPLIRALLVVKDGYLVYEKYYGDGGLEESTNLWSVTKSVSSALIGLLADANTIGTTNQLMADLMPAYPEFDQITLHHALTH
ncbi:MAG: hypothetical protein R3182_12085, partial [Draconibacterium sp.]|nr:hypothetical protein [Draconibacterium sp.]